MVHATKDWLVPESAKSQAQSRLLVNTEPCEICASRDNTLPSIHEIVEARVDIGIAGSAESELFYKGDLEEHEYSDDFKRKLIGELQKALQEQP